MMGYQTIQEIRDSMTDEAEANEREPFEHAEGYTFEEIEAMGGIPALGDYIPPGWTESLDEDYEPIVHMVDSSGFGSPGERAYTIGYFIAHVMRQGYGYGVIEAGQFQVYVGEFVREKS